ncbi:N-acetylmuramoyl-L-alanine amidase [Rhizobium sp. CFBP 8762]|uniref:peptidoglycan recognition protein family protein n=1 Tax=Rhizobium sp. CFBP 8762 TaxID=2775279 RepID=UPI00177D677F|nr:N-acetylmuramoyl-L-alanine amidase [Rhizobium sp. CFBP 8762]MBD8556920.1 N-acetylmuramoyl-L-alanine amidase [Rhizobium sp. CFBP 8762]
MTTSPLRVLPVEWLPAAQMKRIICHWTAGGHKATEFDRGHYHILIEADGRVVRGTPSIDKNAAPVKAGYAAHTLNCNSGSIGVSLCCMAGAVESPFNPGKAPMTKAQWDKLAVVVADLCQRYGIPVTPQTVLSHAEVQANLKIPQRGKWDFTRLAFDPSIIGAKACGDRLRAAVSAHLKTTKETS